MNAKDHASPSAPAPRRDFLWSLGSIVVGGVISVVGLCSGLVVFLDPLLRRKTPPKLYQTTSAVGEGYFRVATLEAVPADGVPRRFPVIADRADAWNFSPDQPIGAVYLRREEGKDVQVFHSTCPHAGCSVSAVQTAEGNAFHCPCHNSSFDLEGRRVARPGKSNPAPRDMDTLNVQVVEGDIWVEFKDFYTGRPTKDAKS